ncbi:MAG: polysaccharide pyruvyl transferase family protein [Gammaproteobacteria bacterium]|nr:MAG: polysaccharide pyruvyl transferase family protein [Gammaproteobacteria bacterium]
MIKNIFSFADRKSLSTGRLPYPHIELIYWSPANGGVNFGDRLAEIISRQMLALHGLSLDDEVDRQERLFTIGSVLHFAKTGDHIWGTGWNGKIDEKEFKAKGLKVHAVRGPLTAEFMRARKIDAPDIFGDPALLIPHIFKNRFKPTAESGYVVIPNLHDLALVPQEKNVVSPLWGWNNVVESILKSRLVLASSLHGLIVAEAFGIPARYVRFSEIEDVFKYKDYYLGTGRTESEFKFATSIEEGLEMGGAPGIRYNPTALIKAFPLALWGKRLNR